MRHLRVTCEWWKFFNGYEELAEILIRRRKKNTALVLLWFKCQSCFCFFGFFLNITQLKS